MIRSVCLTLGASLMTATAVLAQAPAPPNPSGDQRGYAPWLVLTQA
jgi:hypothetical protein